jgi:hypothetical protein
MGAAMNLGSLCRRVDALARCASEEERRPPQVTISLPFAGVLPLGEHRRGAALITVVPVEEYRQELAQIFAPGEVETVLRLGMKQDESELARLIALHVSVLGMSSEQCAAKLDAMTAAARAAETNGADRS